MLEGAKEAGLSEKYQDYLARQPRYQAPERGRAAVGARFFVAIFGPVMSGLEVLTKSTIGSDGLAPWWVVFLVRWVVLFLWLVHDYVFAPVFGRGDGLYGREVLEP